MAGLSNWPQAQPRRPRTARHLVYQVAAALALFLVLLGLKEAGGPLGKRLERGLRTLLTTEWNYQPVLERVVRHGLLAVGGDLPFLEGPAKPTGAPLGAKPLCVPVSGKVVRKYGWNKDPFTGLQEFHPGVDIEAPSGAPVRAVADGKVVQVGTDPELGNFLVVDHGGGVATLYAQLGSVEVTRDQKVRAGDVIGTAGDKGDILGYGLHFEYREKGLPVDPLAKIALSGTEQRE